MAITLRSGGATLTHAQLDENFETLGLAHGDTVANLDVSSIIVNSTLTENRPMIVEANSDSINEVAKFIRPSGSTGTRSALVTHTEFSSNATAGQGTGIWSTYRAADTGLLNLSGIQSEIRQYTSDTDYTVILKLYTMDDNSGANLKSLIEASTDEVRIKNTNAVYIENLPTSDPNSAGQLWNDTANGGILKVSAG